MRAGRDKRAAARVIAARRGNPEIDQVRRAVAVEKDIGGLDVTMNDLLGVCVAQGVGYEGHWRQRVRQRCAGQHADVRAVDELQAVKRAVVFVEFERADDVRVHQANGELPFAPQGVGADAVIDENLECNGCAGDPVRREPGLGRASSAQAAA